MKIKILKPELFVQHRNQIGLVLFTREQDVNVNFFSCDNAESLVIHRNELGSPSMSNLEAELIANDSLRYLASYHNVVEVQHSTHFDINQIIYNNN